MRDLGEAAAFSLRQLLALRAIWEVNQQIEHLGLQLWVPNK